MRLTKQSRTGSYSPLTRLRDEIDRIFERPELPLGDFGEWLPLIDVLEDKDNLTVKAELPGFKREDINVSVHENNLVLSGERRSETEQKEGQFRHSECYYGRFQRTVPLPTSVDTERIEAKYHDGILTVTLPKSEKAKAKQIEVKS